MIVYECDGGPDAMEKFVTLKGAQCYGSVMPEDWNRCVSPVVTWAMGSDGQFLPDHIGVPISGRDVYYMLEVHYDNPELKKGDHKNEKNGTIGGDSVKYLGGLTQEDAKASRMVWVLPVK